VIASSARIDFSIVSERILLMSESWTPEGIESLPWFRELQDFVQRELDRSGETRLQQQPAIEKEIANIKSQQQGWTMSLSNPKLNLDTRALIEEQMGVALSRLKELEEILSAMNAATNSSRTIVDPHAIADRLTRLNEILSCENASRINVELARHIDTIRCYSDGKVVVRTCKLGALALESHASGLFASVNIAKLDAESAQRGRPRRRGVRRLETVDAGAELRQEAHWAADVNRFADLGEDWFWEDESVIPEATFWSKEHAWEVAKLKIDGDHMTNERLAEHFGVTIPTIRKALRFAREQDPALAPLLGKIARTRWEDLNYCEVYKLKTEKTMSVPQLAAHFGKSEPTIRKALELAQSEVHGSVSSDGNANKDS
jgi:hypothetical protein